MTFAPTHKKIIVMGAGGSDFHNFNILYRKNPEFEVVAFTATQIPGISGRIYPHKLAGPHYPKRNKAESTTALVVQ